MPFQISFEFHRKFYSKKLISYVLTSAVSLLHYISLPCPDDVI